MLFSVKVILIILLVLFVIFGVFFLIGPGWYLLYSPKVKPVQLDHSVDEYVKLKESQYSNIKPNNQSHVNWINVDQGKTHYSIVYLHGFSASPKEISPVIETVSENLKINSYFPRLSSHGLENNLMETLTSDQLFQDAEEAYYIGKAIGEKVILVGTSTGASLALWLTARHQDLAGVVLISPNFGINSWKGILAAGPLGSLVARLLAGPYLGWIPKYPEQVKYWTTRYSVNSVRAMTDIVREIETIDFEKIRTPSLTLWTAQDKVVNIRKSISILKKMGSSKNNFEEFNTPNHVLAGAITTPENVPRAIETVTRFIKNL